MLGPSRRLGLWCMLAILSPKQAANDCDSQGDLHQRPSYSSNRVVPLDQSFEGPNADIKETAPAGELRPLVRTPDGGAYSSRVFLALDAAKRRRVQAACP